MGEIFGGFDAVPVVKRKSLCQIAAVCYGENSHFHGKDHFPYVESVPLSTQLWLKTTTAKVVIQVRKFFCRLISVTRWQDHLTIFGLYYYENLANTYKNFAK